MREMPACGFGYRVPSVCYERELFVGHSVDAAGAKTRSGNKGVVDPGIRTGRNVVVCQVRRDFVVVRGLNGISERYIGLDGISDCAVSNLNSVVFVVRRCIVLHEIVLGSRGIRRHIDRVHIDPPGVVPDDVARDRDATRRCL